MRREARLVLALAGVVAALAVAAAVLMLNPVDVEERGITLKAVEPVDVVHVLIRNAHGTFEITFTGEGYEVDDIPADLVDMDAFINLLTSCGSIHTRRAVSATSGDRAVYGLADPAAQVEISYADGSNLVLSIGDEERVTGDTYIGVQGDPAVYLMTAEQSAGFLLPKRAYVEHQVTPRLKLSSPLSAIRDVTFIGVPDADRAPSGETITIEAVAAGDPEVVRAALSLGAPTHIVRGRGVYKLDQTYGVQILGSLLGITARDIVGYDLSHEEITAFGFAEPTMRVVFDLKDDSDAEVETYTLALLHRDDGYFMTCNDNGVIYAVEEPAFLHVEFEKLLVRWFLSPLLMDVRRVNVMTEGQVYDFVITGEGNADREVTCNGRALDIDRFRTLYRLLTSAAHDGRLLEDVAVEGAPLLKLTYAYLDEGKAPDVMELFPGEARRVYARVNSVTELAVREMYLLRVQEALSGLWSDVPIETEW